MKWSAAALVLFVGMTLIGCGSNSSNLTNSNINGTWKAELVNGGSATVFYFGTSLLVNPDGSLSVSNFQFTTNWPCFVSGETESGSFKLNGDFHGTVNGKLDFTVRSGSPSGNTLAMSGTANGNTISGTWTLTGGGDCNGNGSFIMTKSKQ